MTDSSDWKIHSPRSSRCIATKHQYPEGRYEPCRNKTPDSVDEYEQYELHHKRRLTGMWQISCRSDITNFEEVVALDTEIISNLSLGYI